MKTILIYGSPGVGKLTVAEEFTKLTGFNLLHNHLINDLVNSVFKFGTEEWLQTARRIRLDMMERAAKAKKQGLVLTFVYAKGSDDFSLKRIVRQAKKYKGQILFVHLVADRDVVLKRLKHPNRKKYHKIKTHKVFQDFTSREDIFSEVPYKPNLVIDNTKLGPKAVAVMIKKHYKL